MEALGETMNPYYLEFKTQKLATIIATDGGDLESFVNGVCIAFDALVFTDAPATREHVEQLRNTAVIFAGRYFAMDIPTETLTALVAVEEHQLTGTPLNNPNKNGELT